MDQPGTVIESDLPDLTNVSLAEIRGRRGLEWGEIEQRLVCGLGDPAALASDQGQGGGIM